MARLPHTRPAFDRGEGERLLDITCLQAEARSDGSRSLIVDSVDLTMKRREVVGLIGESGSGKTTIARSIIGLNERSVTVTAGTIHFAGELVVGATANTGSRAQRAMRGREVGMVFQAARGSLNPLRRIGAQLREVLTVCRPELDRSAAHDRARTVLTRMALDPDRVMSAYPHQLSGGMCQRAALALAIAPEPQLLIADECTSALDVTSQADVVKLLQELVEMSDTAILFITHDILLASEICSRLVVLSKGRVIEEGPTNDILIAPQEPYTRALIGAVPAW